MKRRKLNPPVLLRRKPVGALICCLVNLVLIVFTVTRGADTMMTRASLEEAMKSRVYSGTVGRHIAPDEIFVGVDGEATTLTAAELDRIASQSVSSVDAGALAILESSPYVDGIDVRVRHSAMLGDGLRYYEGYNTWCVFVARISGNMYEGGVAGSETGFRKFRIIPTYVAAGVADRYPPALSETSPMTLVNVDHAAEQALGQFEVSHGERWFFFSPCAVSYSKTSVQSSLVIDGMTLRSHPEVVYQIGGTASYAGLVIPQGMTPEEEAAYLSQRTAERAKELNSLPYGSLLTGWPAVRCEDDSLTDEEFADQMIEKYGLGEICERLNACAPMVGAIELSSPEKLLPWQAGAMKLVGGRALTPEDAGKPVCMISSQMATALHRTVGATIRLSLADGTYGTSYDTMAQPDNPVFWNGALLEYGAEAEYEIVGTYYCAGDSDMRSYLYPANTVLLPLSAGSASGGTVMQNDLTFTLNKDKYEDFYYNTEKELNAAGWDVLMIRPDYIEAEEQFDALEKNKTAETFLSVMTLGLGVILSAALLVFFGRRDYRLERRLGATRREAGGVYRLLCGAVALVSLAGSGAALAILRRTGTIPAGFFTPARVGLTAGFAAAELCAVVLLAALLVRIDDGRRFGWK